MIDRSLFFLKPIEEALQKAYPEWSFIFERPPKLKNMNEFDLAIPCFSLSKLLQKPPEECARELIQHLEPLKNNGVDRMEIMQGYVNIRFRGEVLGQAILSRFEKLWGSTTEFLKYEKIVIDFSSPNIAKPFGIGHIRSTNIGAALCRIFSLLGAEVVRINHLGDWGTQFGKLMVAYKRFGNADWIKQDPIHNLYKLYVQYHEKEKEDPKLLEEARQWFVKLEKGDSEARELWKWFKDVSYTHFKKIYERLGVEFDYVTGESFYENIIEKTVQHLQNKGFLKASDGALIVDLESWGMPPCLIKKSDGSTLYSTRDLATAEYRLETFHPTKIVYVTGSEQTLHFKQIFKVLGLLGYPEEKFIHVPFGLIRFPEGKMSTRHGNIVFLEDVLDQAEEEALKIVQQKNTEGRLSDSECEVIARQVGRGAILFFDLHAKRTKDIGFDWRKLLSFEGDSGPYLQYTYVRLGALLEKAQEQGYFSLDSKEIPKIKTVEERNLACELLHFPAIVETAAREYEPSIISHGLLELAAAFNQFYMQVPVLKGEAAERVGRLQLVRLTRKILGEGLKLLGVECPEKM